MKEVMEMAVLFLPLIAITALGAGSRFLPGEYKLAFDQERQKFLDQLVYRFALVSGSTRFFIDQRRVLGYAVAS